MSDVGAPPPHHHPPNAHHLHPPNHHHPSTAGGGPNDIHDHPSNTADNNSLRAVSSSFSANDSLNHSIVEQHKNGGGIGVKHSPGVVTATDSLETSSKTNDPHLPHPPSLSSSKSTPTNQQQAAGLPSTSPQSDNSWRQLKQIASIDTKDALHQSQSEETVDENNSNNNINKQPNDEVVVPTPRNKSPNEGHGLEKSISRTSSLSNSPTDEDLEKFPTANPGIPSIPAANSEEQQPQQHHYDAHLPQDNTEAHHSKDHPPLAVHPNGPTPPFDENSPSASTISTKDTTGKGTFFGMKPKHPVHLKSGRENMANEEGDGTTTMNKRRKMIFDPKNQGNNTTKDEDSPANASDFGDLGAMPSWDPHSEWSVASGMTGMESLMQKDLTGQGVLSAFSFSSEMSKKKEESAATTGGIMTEHPVDEGSVNKGKRKQGHVQFQQSFDGQPHPHAGSRKRMHDGRGMPPPGRYRRAPHEEYPPYPSGGHPSDIPPASSHQYDYSPHPATRYRYPPREYEEDPYYDYGYPPRYYDYRAYRSPMPYPYRPPHEYDYPPQQHPRAPPSHPGARPAPLVHASAPRPAISGSWEKSDDLALMEIMKKHKNVKNWDPIAEKLNIGKSGKECHDRWTRFLKPGSRKGQWTEAEDRIVYDAVTNSIEDPFTRWSDLAQSLPGRVGKQVRDRWVNHLNPNINHLPFGKEDDLKLWEGHCALGKRWVEISSKYFKSTRSENHIKNRWYSASFKKFITGEFGPDAYRIGNEQGGLGVDLPGFRATTQEGKDEPSEDDKESEV